MKSDSINSDQANVNIINASSSLHSPYAEISSLHGNSSIYKNITGESANIGLIHSESLYAPYASLDFVLNNNLSSSNASIGNIKSKTMYSPYASIDKISSANATIANANITNISSESMVSPYASVDVMHNNNLTSTNANIKMIQSESMSSPYASVNVLNNSKLQSENASITNIQSERGLFDNSVTSEEGTFALLTGASVRSSGNLQVSGETTLSDKVLINDDVTINGNLNIKGNISIAGWTIEATPNEQYLQIYKGREPPNLEQKNNSLPFVMISQDGNIYTNNSTAQVNGLPEGGGWIASDIGSLQTQINSMHDEFSTHKLGIGSWNVQPNNDGSLLQFYQGSHPPNADQSGNPIIMLSSNGDIWTNRPSSKVPGLPSGWISDDLGSLQHQVTNVQNSQTAMKTKFSTDHLQVGPWNIQPDSGEQLQFYKGSHPPNADQSDTPLVIMGIDGNIWTNRSSSKVSGLPGGWISDDLGALQQQVTKQANALTNPQVKVPPPQPPTTSTPSPPPTTPDELAGTWKDTNGTVVILSSTITGTGNVIGGSWGSTGQIIWVDNMSWKFSSLGGSFVVNPDGKNASWNGTTYVKQV